MTALTAVAAAPAFAFASPAIADRPDRSKWSAALATYERARLEFDRLWNLHSEAEDALPERVGYYFDEFRLGMGMKRDHVVQDITWALCRKEGLSGGIPLHPAEARERCEAKLRSINAEADRLADEFMAYEELNSRERERLGVEALEAAASDYGEEYYFPARKALMETPAPDKDALVIKMGIAATWVDEPFVNSTFADARRLLAA